MQNVERDEDHGFSPIATGVSLLFSVVALFAGLFLSTVLFRTTYTVNFRQILPVYCVFTFLCMRFTNAYRVGKRRLFETGYAVLVSVVFINASMLTLPFFDMEYDVPVYAVLLIAFIQLFLLTVWAFVFHRLYFTLNVRRGAVVVSDTLEHAEYCAGKVKAHSMEFTVIAVVCMDNMSDIPPCDAMIAYNIDTAGQEALYNRCAELGVSLCIAPRMYQLSVHGGKDVQFGDMIALRMRAPGLTPEQAAVKRTFDICASLAAIAIFALPVALLALIIFANDGCPPFYVQRRLTRGGRAFDCIKLRTMISDAEAETGPVLAMESDPRITPIGVFLRSTRLDELPQFLNVLKGDMSVVGPRPEREYFAQEYMKTVPDFERRLAVKAGITGFAHVYGRYDTPPAERINLDMYYIFNYSMLLDMKILVETLRIMCSRSYAEGVKGKRPPHEV